jgi:hypothetical protein
MPIFHRETTVTLEAGQRPEIRMSSVHGNVNVRGEDRGNVQVTARAQFEASSEAEADKMLAELARGIRAEHGRVEITGRDGQRHGGFRFGRRGGLRGSWLGVPRFDESGRGIDHDIVAPRDYSLDARLVYGDATIRDAARVRARLLNGACNAQDVGDLQATLINGSATVLRASGDVDAKLTKGRLHVTDVRGDIDFNLVNGNAVIVNPGGAVAGRCVSGRLDLTGAVRGDVSLHTAHGSIVLNLPPESRFQLDAWSGLGNVSSELEVHDGSSGGLSAPRVNLRTETGSIELRRLREPRAVNA